jgi:hypothetical protein
LVGKCILAFESNGELLHHWLFKTHGEIDVGMVYTANFSTVSTPTQTSTAYCSISFGAATTSAQKWLR